jgi:hypothetical protein
MRTTYIGVDGGKRVGDPEPPPMTSTRALALVLSAQHRTPNAPLATPWMTGAAEIEAALRELGYQVLPTIPMPAEKAAR